MLLDHHCIQDDEGALCIEEEEGDPIVASHLGLLLLSCGDRHGNKEGYEKIGDLVMGAHHGKVGVKDVQENPGDTYLHHDGNYEESRGVLKSENINTNLGKQDDNEKEDSEHGAKGEDHPQTFPGSVVVGKDRLHHREEGYAHRASNKRLEIDSKTVKVVFFDKPVKPH